MDSAFDAAYVARLQAGDPETEADLLRQFIKPVYARLRVKLRSTDVAQEACQETFLRVFSYFRSGKALDNPERLPAFLHGVSGNVALEMMRANYRHDAITPNSPEPVTFLTPEMQAVTEERKAIVRRVLAELPDKDQQLIESVLLEEGDRDSACRRFGVDRNYLRVLLFRARQRFREALSDRGQQPLSDVRMKRSTSSKHNMVGEG